jgi:hypothetical protein
MSLAALNWRYVGSAGFASATVQAVLDAVYTLGLAVTYADATTRTPGSGSAWTWSRYQNVGTTEAAYATPPISTLTQKIILAGKATAATPPMASPDTWFANTLMASVVKNAGAYLAWDNANPFTSGQFFGYWRAWGTPLGVGSVFLYESQEAVMVVISTTAGVVYPIMLGAWVDPESPDVVLDSESDGKLYGAMVVGSLSTGLSASWWSQPTTNSLWITDISIGEAHCGVFTPGAGSILSAERIVSLLSTMSPTGMQTRSGRYGRAAVGLRMVNAPTNLLGRLREIFMFSDAQTPSKQTNAGSTIGYVVSGSTVAQADAILLGH